MKRFGYILAAVVALCFASCDEVPQLPTTKNFIAVPYTSLQLEQPKGAFFLEVNSNVEWCVGSSEEWLVPTQTEFKGSNSVLFNYTANEQSKSRSTIVRVEPKVAGEANVYEIIITQKGTSGSGDGGNDDGNEGDGGSGSGGNDDGSGDGGNEGGNNGGDDSEFAGSGDGTASSPYDVIRALDIINQLAYDETAVYTRGVISEIEQIDLSKGNAKYYISNNGATYNSQLYVYRGNYLDNAKFTSSNQISVGDEVVICGPLLLYQTTKPEINTPNYIVSIVKANGGDGSGNDDGGNDDGGNTGGGNTGSGGGIVSDSGAKYAGWAELPVEEENSDYYYAYHMRPDNGSQRNFSVCYSEEMGCPVWVACPIHSCYIGSASRSSYSQDPVIPASVQVAPDAGTTNQGNWMNRGHMLASNMRTVSSATNKQVFYYTNIAPQNGNNFNTGGGWWNDMEDIEKSEFMCADTLYTVNGCHWTNKNETFNGQVVPTHFYKVFLRTKKGNSRKSVMECSESELKCVAFYVPHSIGKVTPSRSHMISVSELEEITGHTFFPNVPNAPKDTFNASDWGM